jgi:hypothetical protein
MKIALHTTIKVKKESHRPDATRDSARNCNDSCGVTPALLLLSNLCTFE